MSLGEPSDWVTKKCRPMIPLDRFDQLKRQKEQEMFNQKLAEIMKQQGTLSKVFIPSGHKGFFLNGE